MDGEDDLKARGRTRVDVTCSHGAHGLVVCLSGELDLLTSPETFATLERWLRGAGPGEVTIDLTHIAFIDARGISMLIALRRLAAALDQRLVVRHAHGEVDTVLRLTGLAEYLGLPTLPEPFVEPHA